MPLALYTSRAILVTQDDAAHICIKMALMRGPSDETSPSKSATRGFSPHQGTPWDECSCEPCRDSDFLKTQLPWYPVDCGWSCNLLKLAVDNSIVIIIL